MRKPLIVTIVFGVIGCTSILGDFSVSPSSAPGDDGGPGTDTSTTCTMCSGQCVDLTTSNTNCGVCGTVCMNGQTCQASACTCPVGKAFCNNQCVVAGRKQCGPSCAECQADEICGTTCIAAPAPEILTTPISPTGWTDDGGKPIGFTLKPITTPGTIYECRTGPAAKFSPSVPDWKPCDGGAGTGTTHIPKEDPMAPEGTYRTEYRYRSDTYRSAAVGFQYYVHHSLDGLKKCTATNGGPHFTDAEYFQAANLFSLDSMSDGEFPLVQNTFPALGTPPVRTDAIYLENPWIHIPFTAITWSKGIARNSGGWPAAGQSYDLNERSLRHKFVMNPLRSMVLMRRQYQSKARDCKNNVQLSSRLAFDYGPQGFNRGWKTLDCEALVLNSHGNGICMVAGTGPNAGKPVAAQVEERPGYNADSFRAVPAVAPPNEYATVTTTANSTLVKVTYGLSAANISNLASWYIEVPAGTGAWYKIQSVSGLDFTLSVPYGSMQKTQYAGTPDSPVGAGHRFKIHPPAAPGLIKKFVIPSAMAKLHDDGHNGASGQKPGFLGIIAPSQRTKCEVLGCNAGKPWLTYLPP